MDFVWVAVYDDNFVNQYDGDIENKYSELDRERLKEFHILEKESSNPIFAMKIPPKANFIYRRRHHIEMNGAEPWVIHLLGWEKNVGDEVVRSLSWVMPNGLIIQTDDFDEEHSVFYSVEPLPFEEVTL